MSQFLATTKSMKNAVTSKLKNYLFLWKKKERKHDFSLLKFFNTLSQYCFEFENFIILTASMYDV